MTSTMALNFPKSHQKACLGPPVVRTRKLSANHRGIVASRNFRARGSAGRALHPRTGQCHWPPHLTTTLRLATSVRPLAQLRPAKGLGKAPRARKLQRRERQRPADRFGSALVGQSKPLGRNTINSDTFRQTFRSVTCSVTEFPADSFCALLSVCVLAYCLPPRVASFGYSTQQPNSCANLIPKRNQQEGPAIVVCYMYKCRNNEDMK